MVTLSQEHSFSINDEERISNVEKAKHFSINDEEKILNVQKAKNVANKMKTEG